MDPADAVVFGLENGVTECFDVDSSGGIVVVSARHTIRYDTIGEFNVDWKAEYSALSSTRSQKKKLKQPTPVPL